jgi:hypothetical protein
LKRAHSTVIALARSETSPVTRSIYDFEAELFDDWVGEHISGDFFDLLLRFFAADSIEREHEKLPLTYVTNLVVAERCKGMLDRLALRIEHRLL